MTRGGGAFWLFAALATVGTALPLAAFLPWAARHGLDVPRFIEELFVNRISSFFAWDVIVSAFVTIALILIEGRRSHVPADGTASAAAVEAARRAMLDDARPRHRTRIGADVVCEALLLQGWLSGRLGNEVRLQHEPAGEVELVEVDGREARIGRVEPQTSSDLLSEELEVFGRDRIYEEAVRSVSSAPT